MMTLGAAGQAMGLVRRTVQPSIPLADSLPCVIRLRACMFGTPVTECESRLEAA